MNSPYLMTATLFYRLVNDSRPNPTDLAFVHREVEDLHIELTRFVAEYLPIRLTKIVESGTAII